MGPRTLYILRTYWDRLQMTEKAGGHYRHVLHSHRGATQRYPLSPTIFNVVFDAVIWYWVTLLGGSQGDTGQGLRESIKTLMVLLYANYGLAASSDIARLQGAFDVLTGLFDQVGLRTNEGNMVSMACRTCHNPHTWSTEAYTRRVTGWGLSYRKILRQILH